MVSTSYWAPDAKTLWFLARWAASIPANNTLVVPAPGKAHSTNALHYAGVHVISTTTTHQHPDMLSVDGVAFAAA